MDVLITGGAGFLGSALAKRLVYSGHNVRVLDDLSAGDEMRLPQGVSFSRGDINDVPRLWTLLQGVECVYHLAARVSVQESIRYPGDYNTVNVGGTVSVLEAMRDVGVKRLVFVSSGAIYGDLQMQPVSETMIPNPQSPYAVSKLAAEQYVQTIGSLWGVETVCLRVFNAYGPGHQLDNNPVIPIFLKQMLGGGSLVVHGGGHQTRDFVYVEDVVTAMVAAAFAPNVDRRVINVGSGIETSMNELIDTIEQVMGIEANTLHVDAQDGGVSRLCADLIQAKVLLDYAPQVLLAEGLERMCIEDSRFAIKTP